MVNVNSLIKKYQGYFSSSDNDRLDTVWNFADGTRVLDPVKESLSIDKYELVFIYALALRPEIPRAEAILEEIGWDKRASMGLKNIVDKCLAQAGY